MYDYISCNFNINVYLNDILSFKVKMYFRILFLSLNEITRLIYHCKCVMAFEKYFV